MFTLLFPSNPPSKKWDPVKETVVGSGVSLNVYSLFWDKVRDCYLIGTDQWVPFVRLDLYIPEWEAIGRYLLMDI